MVDGSDMGLKIVFSILLILSIIELVFLMKYVNRIKENYGIFLIRTTAMALVCMVANIVSPVGLIDVVVGGSATLIAAVATYLLRDKNRFIAIAPAVVANAVLVGFELYKFYNVGFSFPACMFWVGLGEAAAVYVLGYPLSLLLDKYRKIFD